MIQVPLKRKYRMVVGGQGGNYRTRTGPSCCNSGCGHPRRKIGRVKWGKGTGIGGGK